MDTNMYLLSNENEDETKKLIYVEFGNKDMDDFFLSKNRYKIAKLTSSQLTSY